MTSKLSGFDISADCKYVNLDLKISVTSQLPAEHGTTLEYRCAKKRAKKGGPENFDLICKDGIISFSGGSTPCFKIGEHTATI